MHAVARHLVGFERFDKDAALYIRPMYRAEHNGALLMSPDPDSTRWCLTLYQSPMREPEGLAITLSPYRKPAPSGTFLDGITRQRVTALLREAGASVVECTLGYSDILAADEIFSSGNYSKAMPINRIDDRALQSAALYRKARELYWVLCTLVRFQSR